MRIEYTTQWEVYPFCHLYDLEVSPALIDGGIQTYELGVSDTQIAIWDNAGEQPEYGIYELETIQEFESTALVYNLIQNATAIASITVDVTIYALTDVRVMVSTSEEGETYTWNPISTHWELHSDDLTACSVTDFNAADFAKLLSEVGSTVWVHVALITLDGTVSPEFKELSASYTRGIDFFQNTEHYLGTAFNVEVVSDTISRFKNLTGSVQYMDCSVHIVT